MYVLLFACSFRPAATTAPPAPPDAPPDAFVNAAWPCDPQTPASPGGVSLTPSGATFDFTQISLSNTGQVVVVSPGATVTLALQYAMQDTRCMTCRDQIEVGWIDSAGSGDRIGCEFDAVVSHSATTTGDIAGAALTAPTATGDYDLRVNIGQRNQCSDGSNWWVNGTPPPATQTIVKLCVH